MEAKQTLHKRLWLISYELEKTLAKEKGESTANAVVFF